MSSAFDSAESAPNSKEPATGTSREKSGAKRVSLGKRLRASSVTCHGMKPNWTGYSGADRRQIASASKVYYPGPVYGQILEAGGVRIFPRNYYHFMGNKIAQSNLFQLLEIPHPRTRLYYGRDRLRRIEQDFSYPFVAKTPVGSSKGLGVFLISNTNDLSEYLENHNPAYIQEFLPISRDLRAVVIGGQVVHAYWRIHKQGNFRNNVSQGGRISFEDIPESAMEFARQTAMQCGFDEVGLDICEHGGGYLVLEANMAYGLDGFRQKGMDIHKIIGKLADKGAI